MSKVDEALRSEGVQYVKAYYAKCGSVPSVRDLVKKFKRRLTRGGFYELFPDGIKQLCREAEIPVPAERLKYTAEALMTRKTRRNLPVAEAEASTRLVLSETQSRRLYGVSHLENGKDPLLIIDEMLDRDSTIRRLVENPQASPTIVTFLQEAFRRQWEIPMLVDILTQLWNAHVMSLSAKELGSLADIMVELNKHNVDPKQFISEATDASSFFGTWRQYKLGKIGVNEVLWRLKGS